MDITVAYLLFESVAVLCSIFLCTFTTATAVSIYVVQLRPLQLYLVLESGESSCFSRVSSLPGGGLVGLKSGFGGGIPAGGREDTQDIDKPLVNLFLTFSPSCSCEDDPLLFSHCNYNRGSALPPS